MSEVSRRLIEAGKADKPSELERAGALARLEAAGAFSGLSPSIPAWGAGMGIAAAAVAIWVFVHARGTSLRTEAPGPKIVAEPTLARSAPKPQRPLRGTHAAPSGGPSTCESANVPDVPPTVCSEPGHVVALELVNSCADTVDVFWVDFECRETFTQRLAPGETMRHRSYDTHPWRVRDHATHRLIKEWVGPRLPDVPDEPIELPNIVVTDRSAAEDVAPARCSRASRRTAIRFVNERTSGVSVVFWVDDDCKEQVSRRMEPGETWETETFVAHPWRVRDEKGGLLVDYVPDVPDETIYVSLP